MALEQTAHKTDPELRRLAVWQWLKDQGFSTAAINDSDLAIRSAISIDLAPNKSSTSHATTSQRSHPQVNNSALSSVDKVQRSVKHEKQEQTKSSHRQRTSGRHSSVKSSPQKTRTSKRHALSWLLLIALLSCIGLTFSILLLPVGFGSENLTENAKTAAAIAIVPFVVACVASLLGKRSFWKGCSAVFALVAMPLFMMFGSTDEENGSEQGTLLSEYGFFPLVELVAELTDGRAMTIHNAYVAMYWPGAKQRDVCDIVHFSPDTEDIFPRFGKCEVIDSEVVFKVVRACEDPKIFGSGIYERTDVIYLKKYSFPSWNLEKWKRIAQNDQFVSFENTENSILSVYREKFQGRGTISVSPLGLGGSYQEIPEYWIYYDQLISKMRRSGCLAWEII